MLTSMLRKPMSSRRSMCPGSSSACYYRRYPHEARGRVLSITRKVLPEVTGDGRRSLEQLILADSGRFACTRLTGKARRDPLSYVPAAGERVPLVEVGSHCRGAIFLNASGLLTPTLETAVERVSRTHPGFYLGRYDVRAESVEALQAGRFKVLELNGVGAEPAHIYDPAVSLLDAYRELYRHWRTSVSDRRRSSRIWFACPSVGDLWEACAGRTDAPDQARAANGSWVRCGLRITAGSACTSTGRQSVSIQAVDILRCGGQLTYRDCTAQAHVLRIGVAVRIWLNVIHRSEVTPDAVHGLPPRRHAAGVGRPCAGRKDRWVNRSASTRAGKAVVWIQFVHIYDAAVSLRTAIVRYRRTASRMCAAIRRSGGACPFGRK